MAERGTIIEGTEVLKLIGKRWKSKKFTWRWKNDKGQSKKSREKLMIRTMKLEVASAMAEANMMKKLDYPSLPRIVTLSKKEKCNLCCHGLH